MITDVHKMQPTWMDGLLRWPRLDVACRGSWPNTIMLGLISRNASMTT